MANFDDDFDDLTESEPAQENEVPSAPEEEAAGAAPAANNRNFMLAIGVLGGIFILLVIVLVVAAIFLLPRQKSVASATNAVIQTQNAATLAYATEVERSAVLAAEVMTLTATANITNTPIPPTITATPVVAKPSFTPTASPAITETFSDPRTATVAALLTQAATSRNVTLTPGTAVGGAGGGGLNGTSTSTALPTTGFADEVGLPGLFGLAVALIVVIFLARRLRISTSG